MKIQNPKSKIQTKAETTKPKLERAPFGFSPFRVSGFLLILNFGFWFSLSGCIHSRCPPKQIYNGRTDPMAKVVAAVNTNNAGIQTIWSDHTFAAEIHDDKGRAHRVDGDGVLLFRKTPDHADELLLQGSAVIGQIFEIGSTAGSDAQYWVAVVPEVATEWWGHYRNLGKPCSKTVPIRPDLVMEVLGVSDIDTNFMQPPIPTMRFNSDEAVYMLTFNVPAGNRWIVQKEIWYDVHTKLPRNVLLFDENGRVQLRAYLTNHKVLDGTDNKRIATHYDLFFPETRDWMIFDLKNPKLTKKGLPRPGTISRRPIADVREVQLDEDCP
jgi:hypothetical protein